MKSLIALALSLAASSLPLAAQDIIKFKEPDQDPDLECEILSLTHREIRIAFNGPTIPPIDARKVAEIIPSPRLKTFHYSQAEQALADGDYETAIARFERVVDDPRASEVQRQLSRISIVRCHCIQRHWKSAVASARLLRSKLPDSFYLRESFELEIKAELSSGDGRLLPRLYAARLERERRWKEALKVYRKLAAEPEAFDEAPFGELRCLTELADWPELDRRAGEILKEQSGRKNPESRLSIAAWTGKGDVELQAGRTQEALLDYLQGAMVLGRGETSPENEAALGKAAGTCLRLAAGEADPARKEAHRRHARELADELQRSYPRSPYKEKIEKALREDR